MIERTIFWAIKASLGVLLFVILLYYVPIIAFVLVALVLGNFIAVYEKDKRWRKIMKNCGLPVE